MCLPQRSLRLIRHIGLFKRLLEKVPCPLVVFGLGKNTFLTDSGGSLVNRQVPKERNQKQEPMIPGGLSDGSVS